MVAHTGFLTSARLLRPVGAEGAPPPEERSDADVAADGPDGGGDEAPGGEAEDGPGHPGG
jgi:hypothetical protein